MTTPEEWDEIIDCIYSHSETIEMVQTEAYNQALIDVIVSLEIQGYKRLADEISKLKK